MRLRAGNLMAAFFILSGSLAAQESPPPKPEKIASKDPCSIAGLVVKSGTNEPLKKAHIYLQKEDDQKAGYSAHTDAAGHFVIPKIEPGRYKLQVEHTGYVTQSYGQDSGSPKSHGAILTLDPGRKIQDLLFRMVPWAVISGRITDEDGDPVPNVEVQAMRHSFSEGKRELETEGDAQTNDLGEFRLYGLAKGRYFIRAQVQQDWQPALPESTVNDSSSNPETGYAPVYYPGTSDTSHAAAIDVSPGQEVPSVDFTFIPIRTFRIRGRVFDAIEGQPAKDCWLFLMPHDPSLTRFFGAGSQTDCNKGAFELRDVAPGSYYVVAGLRSSSSERSYRARVPVEVTNTNVDDVNLTIGPGMDLVGRVLVEGTGTVDLSDLRVWLEDREDRFGFGGPGNVDLKPDGTLKIQNMTEGTYHVRIYDEPPDVYLRSARANGEDILEKGLTIAAGGSRDPLEIVLSSAGARIEGTVTDENGLPSAGAVVALVPEGQHRKQYHLYKNTTTDQYGKFILRGVTPGQYKLFSWKEVENDAWEDPDFLKPFESKGVEVNAEENGHATLALKLIPTESLKQ
jgi:protocatechuate 3,4-dioxygenase beta subunit